jgi:hypothetical protein
MQTHLEDAEILRELFVPSISLGMAKQLKPQVVGNSTKFTGEPGRLILREQFKMKAVKGQGASDCCRISVVVELREQPLQQRPEGPPSEDTRLRVWEGDHRH